MSDNNLNTKDFVIGTLIGGIVGASVALLFAPKSGKELRSDINYGASQAMERANEFKDAAQQRSVEWKDKAVEKGSAFTQKAKDKTIQLTRDVSEKTQGLAKKTQAQAASMEDKVEKKVKQ